MRTRNQQQQQQAKKWYHIVIAIYIYGRKLLQYFLIDQLVTKSEKQVTLVVKRIQPKPPAKNINGVNNWNKPNHSLFVDIYIYK